MYSIKIEKCVLTFTMLGVDAANAELVRIALKAGKFNAGTAE